MSLPTTVGTGWSSEERDRPQPEVIIVISFTFSSLITRPHAAHILPWRSADTTTMQTRLINIPR